MEVKFMDGAGNQSFAVNDTIILDTVAPKLGTLTAAGAVRQVNLQWTGFSDALSGIRDYLLYFSTQPFSYRSKGTKIYQGKLLSFTQTNLAAHTTYYYRVYARDKAGNISAGAPAHATTN